ncbi:rhotekin-2-like isoform X1 [Tachypleus tridentatus]|uniref:rhotekin-2-like isoform X1 n=2 Tax=Tachypleus tridentatus TaxID=6853 RepID=UPI003FD13520
MTTNYSCFGPVHFRPSSWIHNSDTLFTSATDKDDVIQDLDLYFIRQIAHSLQEYDLEHKIDLEIKMREGTAKLLAACKHPMQSLEAAKSLLTSNERMTAYMGELQRRKSNEKTGNPESSNRVSPSTARVAVSDIRIPLIWKDSDHFKNKGDHRKFSVFCLLKIGTEIYDTALINNVDRSMTDICFDDMGIFNQVPANFEFRLEIYSHIFHDDLSIASTPSRIKKKISSSVSRTIGRKLAASVKDELNSIDIGPKFELVAHGTLCVDDTDDEVKTHDLMLETLESSQHQLPFFGQFCCRLAIQPDFISEERLSGFLGVVSQVGNISGCRRLWCSLKNLKLSFWPKAEDFYCMSPILVIPVNKDTRLRTEVASCAYPRSFRLVNVVNGKAHEQILAADSDLDHAQWTENIRQHARDHETWGVKAEILMEIPSPGPSRFPGFLRQGSLYEQTRITELDESKSHSNSCTEEDTLRVSPTSLRSRSSSTSSATSSASSSRRHFLPFLRYKQNRDIAFS